MRYRGGGVGHRVLVDTGREECEEIEEEELEEVQGGYASNKENLEDEVLHYGYEDGHENEEEEDNERAISCEYGRGRGPEEVIEEEEEMRGDLGPEDGEAKDEHDNYFGYAPL